MGGKRHFADLLAARMARHQTSVQDQESEPEVAEYSWERTRRMWERIEQRMLDQEQEHK